MGNGNGKWEIGNARSTSPEIETHSGLLDVLPPVVWGVLTSLENSVDVSFKPETRA